MQLQTQRSSERGHQYEIAVIQLTRVPLDGCETHIIWMGDIIKSIFTITCDD